MRHAVGNNLDSEALSIANRFFPDLAVTHYSRKLKNFRDPAAVFLPIQVNCQIHSSIILSPAEYKLLNMSSAWRRAGFTQVSVS